ncbi:hypothetical protein BDW74DRAFT_160790 [Aspergillus multicolor]|uniref:uncharacterized protein n=1 Tax=Aspergillus multicolor TaxID=41759 RepID=UPI003CCE1C42
MATLSSSRLLGKHLLRPRTKIILHPLHSPLHPTSRVLVRMLPIMAQLSTALSHTRVSRTLMHILRGRAPKGRLRSSSHTLLAVAPQHIGVHSLLAAVVDGVGLVGAAGGCGAGRVRLGVEFGDVVCWGGFYAGGMLVVWVGSVGPLAAGGPFRAGLELALLLVGNIGHVAHCEEMGGVFLLFLR